MKENLSKDHVFKFYLETLSFLHKSFDDYFYLLDFTTDRIYFFGDIAEKYDVFHESTEYSTVAEWCRIVYPRDLARLVEDLNQVRTGEQLTHSMEYRLLDKGGDLVWISCSGKALRDHEGNVSWMLGRVSDSAWSNRVDELTGTLLFDTLRAETDKILEEDRTGFFLVIGIDDLKKINMKNGRDFGDEVLCRVAAAVEEQTNRQHNVYRINGDCFAVNLPNYKREDVQDIFEGIQKIVTDYCTVSGGCVPYREYHIPDSGSLCQYAERTLELGKSQGKNVLKFFSTDDYEKELESLELREELMNAVKNSFTGFSVCYQPQVHPVDFSLFGAEALLRFSSPTRGVVSPVEFIPILEQSGLICSVGLWILEQALLQCKVWRKYHSDFHISVNVSYTQLQDRDLANQFLWVLKKSGLPGDALTLEVTESMELHDYPELNGLFAQLKMVGVEISVDDFGTGYSSLSRLKELDIDEIKIDRCFVTDIQNSAYNYRLLSNMLEWATKSGIRVCCEGVETAEELAVLSQLRPSLLQGYLFSRPCTPQEFTNMYLDHRSSFYSDRLERERLLRERTVYTGYTAREWSEGEKFKAVLEAQSDVIYVSDLSS